MIRKIAAFAALAFLFTSVPSYAVEMNNLYRGVRPLGMGGAFTALADDENAVFYNPAGLGSIHHNTLDLIAPEAEVSQNMLNLINDAKALKSGDTVGATSLLTKYVGKPQHVVVGDIFDFTRHNFELGAFARATIDAQIHTPSFPVFSANINMDAGAFLGLAHSFVDDRLQVGIDGKFVQRSKYYRELTALDIANSSNNMSDQFSPNSTNLKTSSKIGMDFGLIYKPDMPSINPSIGISVLNISGMDFGNYTYTTGTGSSATSTTISNKIPQTINLGIAVNRQLWIFNTTLAADYQDISNASSCTDTTNLCDTDKAKRLHVGAEIKLPYILSFRAGLNQGYVSYGLGVNFWLIEIKYAYFQEETGAYAGQLGDIRQAAQVIIGF